MCVVIMRRGAHHGPDVFMLSSEPGMRRHAGMVQVQASSSHGLWGLSGMRMALALALALTPPLACAAGLITLYPAIPVPVSTMI